MNLVGEWLSPDFHQDFGQLFEIYLFFAVVSVGFSTERKSWAEIALIVLLVHEALGANRNVPLLAIVATPLVARHTQSALRRLPVSGDGQTLFGSRPPVGVVAIILCTAVLYATMMASAIVRVVDPGAKVNLAGIAETSFQLKAFPYDACAFLERERFPVSMHLYNKYDDGGFLIWRVPEYKVVSDGRADVYFGKQLDDVERLNALHYGWEQILDSYGCDVILISALQKQTRLFLGSARWAVVYVDNPALTHQNFHINDSVILVRRDAAHAALIARCRRDCPAVKTLQAASFAPDFPALQ
jgi:hypothetical protein